MSAPALNGRHLAGQSLVPDSGDSDTARHPTPRHRETTARRGDTRQDGARPERASDSPGADGVRRVRLTPASAIEMRPVRWLWQDRIPAGAITLIPGREGIGKSLALAWLSARLTRGQLPGRYRGQPRPVIYAATEDSWAHTIGPRLYAAGADLDWVYRVDVDRGDGRIGQLTLPLDCGGLADEITRLGVVMLAADPLLSLIGSHIDSHRDRELRTALEPLAALADDTGCAVAGLAHFNKSASEDALNLITGSRAFSAVARAVLAVARDPSSDDGTCLLSQAKNNLGRTDLPSLTYVIRTADVPTREGPASVGVLSFTGETSRHVTDILAEGPDDPDERAERDEAASWLTHYLTTQGGEAPSRDILKAAHADGFATRTMQRARRRAGVSSHPEGFPRRTIWRLPSNPPPPAAPADDAQSRQWRESCPSPESGATVAPLDPSPESPHDTSRPAMADGNGQAAVDADALFDAVEDVLAATHPSVPAAASLPDTITDAAEDLAAVLDDASGAGPHDELIAASRRLLDAATDPGEPFKHPGSPEAAPALDPGTVAALAALGQALPPVAPQSRHLPRTGTTGATGATGATAAPPPASGHPSAPDPSGPGDNRQAIGQARTTPAKEARPS